MMDILLVSAMAVASAAGAEPVELIEIGAASRLRSAVAEQAQGSARCSERRSGRDDGRMLVIRDAETGEVLSRIDPRDHGETMGRVLERLLDEASTS